MNSNRVQTAVTGILTLCLGVIFCILLFGYGVTQEAPIGKLEGVVTLRETGKPLPHAEVSLSIPDDDEARDIRTVADAKGHFRFKNVRVGEYDVHVEAREHHGRAERVVINEGHATKYDVVLEPNEPYLRMYASQKVWTTGDDPQVELHGFLAGDVIDVEVDRVGFQDLLTGGHFNDAINALKSGENDSIPAALEKFAKKELEFRHKVQHKDYEGAFIEPLTMSNLPEGFYWVKCRGGARQAATYINVTNIALVTKTANRHALAYVTDLMSGKPIKGATIWTTESTAKAAAAVTDADGLAETNYGPISEEGDSRTCFIGVYGKSTAVVGIYAGRDSEETGDAKFVIYTERPIYRPGDEVQFKGIVRRRTGLGYSPPQSGTVEVELKDTDDERISKFSLPVSAHGTFSGHFTTSKEAGPGLYRIAVKGFDSSGSHFVHMIAYRKPEISIQLKSVKPYYYYGDKARATIQCSYYFGGPVVGAKISGSVFGLPDMDADPDDPDWSEMPGYEGGEMAKQIEAVTDSKGLATIEFDTRLENQKSPPLTDLSFNVEVSATDASKKYADGSGTVHVVQGAYRLSATSLNRLVSRGDQIDLLVHTRSLASGGPPVSGRSVTVQVCSEQWKGNKSVQTVLNEVKAVTGQDGYAQVPLKADREGSLILKTYSRDDAGHTIIAEDTVYVMGGRWEAAADQAKIQVLLDKRRYKAGDAALVMVRTLVPGGSALVTVQTDQVLWKKVIPLAQNENYVKLPVTPEFLPNCFVNVAYVHHKKFYEGSTRLSVQPGNERLAVTVDSDKAVYEPGGTVGLTVHTKDPSGKPVAAEVSLGVVDESLYAIRGDDFDVYEAFYPKKSNSVQTTFSFSEMYLDGGDKGGTNVVVRRKFQDTAVWRPSVQTDATGTAKVTFDLPDNLTEWRATAVGVTDATSVGKTTTKFKARKNLMVRLEMPEFLVQQDDREMVVMVTNDTGADQDVRFSLAATGAEVVGDLRQTVRVAADRPTSLKFRLKTGNPGTAKLTAKAWIVGGPSDGVEQGFPVLAHGVPIRNAWSEQFDDAKDFEVNVGTTMDRTTGRLKINVSGGLAGDLVSSLDGLIGFPYGCAEQTMSRFMPSILVSKTVKDLGLPSPKLEKQIPKIASDSMVRLARMQHEDGGWGWWENGESDPFMTALVLDGLDRCKAAGFPVQKVKIDKALTFCAQKIRSADWKKVDLKAQCYLVYALAKYGKTAEAVKAYQTLLLRNCSAADRATLILATNEMGDAFRAERDRMLDRLAEQAHQGPLGAYWDNSDWEWGNESTSLSLTAFMTVRPGDPIVPRIVRFLMAHRKGDMWDSTRDTSYALVGLTKYLASTHEMAASFDARVLIEGRLVRQVHLEAKDPDHQSAKIVIPVSDLHPGPNTVRIEKFGVGACYAALDLQGTEIKTQLSAAEPIPGLKVERKYYRMEAGKLEDGSIMLLPSKKPVTWAESGDTIRVELTVKSSKAREFIMIEDPTPSNCRVTDRESLDEGEQWSFWWDRLVIRDEKVAFFIRHLHEGTQTITYTMRAEGLGVAHALPTTLSNMYDLATHSSAAESLLEVK